MKFLLVAPRFHTNQIWVVDALQKAGHQVEFFSLYTGQSEDHTLLTPHVIPLSWLGKWMVSKAQNEKEVMTRKRLYGFPKLPYLIGLFRKVSPDVIIVRNPNMPITLACMFLSRLTGKKTIIYTLGDLVFAKPYKEKLRAICLGVFKAAWMTAVRTERDKTLTPHPRMFYVPLVAPPVEAVPNLRPHDPANIQLLSVGKFEPRKNHLLLLDAAKDLLKAGGYHLTLIGEATAKEHVEYLDGVYKKIADEGLEPFVTVLKNQPYSEMADRYKAADVFIIPARNEPLGMVVPEALAAGCPVICSTTCGARCYIEAGVSGMIFKSDDVDSLREAIVSVVRSPETITAMSQAARQAAIENHSGSSYLASIEKMIASIS